LNWATKIVVTVLGGLIAYYLSSTFLTGLITGTTTADTLLQNILPITIAGAVVLAIVMISFKAS
jgi:hypothetical protein